MNSGSPNSVFKPLKKYFILMGRKNRDGYSLNIFYNVFLYR